MTSFFLAFHTPPSTGEEEKKANWQKRKQIPCNKSISMCCSYLLIKGFSFSLFPHLPPESGSHLILSASTCTSNTSSLFFRLFCGCFSILFPSHLSFAALFACWCASPAFELLSSAISALFLRQLFCLSEQAIV